MSGIIRMNDWEFTTDTFAPHRRHIRRLVKAQRIQKNIKQPGSTVAKHTDPGLSLHQSPRNQED